MFRRLVAILATLTLLLLIAAPALAADLTNPTPISSDDAEDIEEYEGTAAECADLPEGVAPAGPGEVLWHFVLNQYSSNTQTVTATFETAGIMTQGPDKENDGTLHYYFRTGSPDTLLSASSSADGMLQLSHFCNGGPPPVIPEAPASVLILVTGALAAAGFVVWQMRRSPSHA